MGRITIKNFSIQNLSILHQNVICISKKTLHNFLSEEKVSRVVVLTELDEDLYRLVGVEFFDLWWDKRRPDGLGSLNALSSPPKNVAVSIRSSGISEVRIRDQSFLTTSFESRPVDRQNASSRSLALLIRALKRTSYQEYDKFAIKDKIPRSYFLFDSISTLITLIFLLLYKSFFYAIRPICRKERWRIAYRVKSTEDLNSTLDFKGKIFIDYGCPFDTFYADPIAFSSGGIDAIFFEEFPYGLGRGVISCATLGAGGVLTPSKIVLQKPYHLSYPFIFSCNDSIYMIPETSANSTIELYRCISFPYEWKFEVNLFEGINATDATPYYDGEKWWIFATVGEEGSYTWDELCIFFADNLFGPWKPHLLNPVKCDSTSSRPAGPLFSLNGQLIRPTQNCSRRYGGGINFCKVDALTEVDFNESVLLSLPPSALLGQDGLHTFSFSDRIEVIDLVPKYSFRWNFKKSKFSYELHN